MDEFRTIKAAPFCWQHKSQRRKIRAAFDRDKTVNSALGVYDALTEVASDHESEVFQTTHAKLSEMSGWSPRTVQDRLQELKEIGLVEISTPALKSPSTFRLLADRQRLPIVRQRAKKAPLPSLEQGKKNLLKTCSTKANKLSTPQKELADRIEAALGVEWINDAGKWVKRIKSAPGKSERVIAEVESAAKEHRIKTTAARYAEKIWKEFAP